MTFARPIKLQAGPTPGSYYFLSAVCLFAGLVTLFSTTALAVKLLGMGITLGTFLTGWIQLDRQKGCQVTIHTTGAINIKGVGVTEIPTELGRGTFRSRLFVTLPLRIAGGRRQNFLINPANNDPDDYRRLLVWLHMGQTQEP
jgi:hypothetical protein